jgi:hypothetical protein
MSRKIDRISITLPNGATAEVGGASTTRISSNKGVHEGEITLLKVVTPNFTNTITTTIKIYDSNGALKYTSEALAENSGASGRVLYPPVPIPISEKEYVTATPSGDPGGTGGIVTIDMEYKPDWN